MGRRKTQAASMGKTIIKDRFRGKRDRGQAGSYLHTSDLNDGYDWGRLNLQSVTEQSNLEEFLMTAELANTEFVAEKLNIQIVSPQQPAGLLSNDELQEVKAAQEKHRELLRIPRRPPWDENTTPEELDRAEKESFVAWLRQLSRLKEMKHVELTPYEVNLEFWRQLWRVIEMSDVVVQIVDARNPLLFWCPDVDKYVKEVDPSKVTAILINKADYLTQNQRKAWASYFSEKGVQVVFFSALEETQKLEESKRQQKLSQSLSDAGGAEGGADTKDAIEEKMDADVARTMEKTTDTISAGMEGLESKAVPEDSEGDFCVDGEMADTHDRKVSGEVSDLRHAESADDNADEQKPENVPGGDCPLRTTQELLELFRSMAKTQHKPGVTTIGMVGYPNVGKSSTINAILKTKKVPVSATPGRTKTYQTAYVEKDLMLCDCPGLVFPSFVTTKADQVVNGILSIDQLRDHISPRIPRDVLESTYGINLPLKAEWEDPNRPPSAWELLNTYGYMRGYMTQNGNPDCPRTARYILKDYVNGKLLFCIPPPGIDAAAFQLPPYTERVIPSKKKMSDQPQSSAKSAASRLDKEFFAKMTMRGHTQGPRKVSNYARSEGLRQIASADQGEGQASGSSTPCGSQQSLAGKPWKRHNNRNKKEKLRRVYADHDKY
ncbi:hypothetical protein BaRGS_00027363 [Batillaria attramentaria]|uniref:Large subunit GTPase 1 homolog n=1 Tax=Batillaria attramentaria TaxID=370345 RepID=A0ABD0K2T1_9CAEN